MHSTLYQDSLTVDYQIFRGHSQADVVRESNLYCLICLKRKGVAGRNPLNQSWSLLPAMIRIHQRCCYKSSGNTDHRITPGDHFECVKVQFTELSYRSPRPRDSAGQIVE